MFTVLHRDNGVDMFYEAVRVERIGPLGGGPEGIYIAKNDAEIAAGEQMQINSGEVFVMNASGKTVGHYYMPNQQATV